MDTMMDSRHVTRPRSCMAYRLRLIAAPRARCGVALTAPAAPDAPLCTECQRRATR